MKTVYIIGFQGIGIRDPRYAQEPGLIQLGHVGITFADETDKILGFHPTQAAIEGVGGIEAALNHLRERETLDGRLQNDYPIFERAYQLSQDNMRITVWQHGIPFSDADFERIKEQALTWYNQSTVFPYAFPGSGAMPEDRDNCATFWRKLRVPLLEITGHLHFYIPILRSVGQKWQPKGA